MLSAGSTVRKTQYYDYTPLTNPGGQIRLLKIQRFSEMNDIVVCSVGTYDLENCPPFAAISYVWGVPYPLRDIYINAQHTQVQYSCWVALWQIRYHAAWEYIWIDSLCINQSDNIEKSIQVQLMGTIYNKAELVIASLGDGVDFNKLAQSLRDRREESNVVGAMPEVTGILQKRANGRLLANASFMGQLAKTTYFDRMWVVQELVLASDVKLLCGRQTLSWDELVDTINCWDHAYALGNHKRIRKIIEHRNEQRLKSREAAQGTVDDLVEFLLCYGHGTCTEARDKIYSLLGLVSPDNRANQHRLPVDYNKSLFQVLVDFVDLLGRAEEIDGKAIEADRMALVISHLVKWFGLTWNDNEVQDFLTKRLEALGGTKHQTDTSSSISSSNRSLPIECKVLKSRRICSSPCESVYINTSKSVAKLFWDSVTAAGLQFVGFDTHNLSILCVEQQPALLASPDVRPGDILLRTDIPKLGSPLLIVRPCSDGRGCNLIGKAIQLDPRSAFWETGCRCADDFEEVEGIDGPDQTIRHIKLHPRDLLALTLLRQRVSESLIGPVTTSP